MEMQEITALRSFIVNALKEDVGDGDHTSLATIPKEKQGQARLLIKEEGVLAGVNVALEVFRTVDNNLSVSVNKEDGTHVQVNDEVLTVSGNIHSILIAERLVLNLMQRMSGVATETNRIVQLIEGTGTKVLDTRKTTPLLRFLEKKAVTIGGGTNHRFGLYDMILIKDNHVDYAGGIKEAIIAANTYRETLSKPIEIEIEVRNFEELLIVHEYGHVDRIMLDNFTPTDVRKAVELTAGRFILEASGGITKDNVRDYAEAGVNYISIGALTHSVKSLDMSLKAHIID